MSFASMFRPAGRLLDELHFLPPADARPFASQSVPIGCINLRPPANAGYDLARIAARGRTPMTRPKIAYAVVVVGCVTGTLGGIDWFHLLLLATRWITFDRQGENLYAGWPWTDVGYHRTTPPEIP
jgi:hypothetical protein